MTERDLHQLLQTFSPADRPLYILLPRSEYNRLRTPWGLP